MSRHDQNTASHEYAKGRLLESEASADPLVLFADWYNEALDGDLIEPTAMALGTVGEGGQPSVRMVLLKMFDHRGFVFFTNYRSRKANELDTHPRAAATLWWDKLERQVRIEGSVEKASEDDADTYFATRHPESRLSAWASLQSSEVESREVLERKMEQFREQFSEDEIPRPPHWGGYRIIPQMIEFWQGRAGRLHDRLAYTRQADGSWKRVRLSP